MKRALIVLGYLVGWVVVSAVLAPLLYQLFHGFYPAPFSRYVNRSLMISALLLLWPLGWGLQIKNPREWGVAWPETGGHCLRMPFLAGFSSILGLVAFALGGGWMQWMPFAGLKIIGVAVLAACLVPVLEGLLFRGLFQFQLIRSIGVIPGLVLVSLLFAVLHFVKVPRDFVPTPLTWWSGFQAWSQAVRPLLEVENDWQRFLTVWAVGLMLGTVAWRDGHIWRSVAIHAGWVLGLQLARGFTTPGVALGGLEPRLDGSLLTVAMVALFAGYWFVVLDRHRFESA